MSDYIKDERVMPQVLRGILMSLLAFAVAFAFSGISLAHSAYADGEDTGEPGAAEKTISYTLEYVCDGTELTEAEAGDAWTDIQNNVEAAKKVTLEDGAATAKVTVAPLKVSIDGYECNGITVKAPGDDAKSDPVADDAQDFEVSDGATVTVTYSKIETPPATTTAKIAVNYVDDSNAAIAGQNPDVIDATLTDGSGTVQVSAIDKKTITGYTFSKITYTTGPETKDVAASDTTIPVQAGTVINVVYTKNATVDPDPDETSVSYTVKYVGLDTPQDDYTRKEDVADDEEAVISVWEEDINKPFAGYKIVSVKLENGTVVKAGDEIPNGSTIIVTYEKDQPKTGQWVRDSRGWWYKYSDGTWPASQWLEVNGKYYHFDAKGWMQTGWLQTNTGVQNNALAKSEWFYLNSNGDAAIGWAYVRGVWYYLLPAEAKGEALTATMVADTSETIKDSKGVNQVYSFEASGAMRTGWNKIADIWFYFDASGAQVFGGWAKSGAYWYWLTEDDNGGGQMAKSAWVDGNNYYVGENGAMLIGWARIGKDYTGATTIGADNKNAWYCFDGSGRVMKNEWLKSYGHWYWLTANGTMAENEFSRDGNYYLGADGIMVTGWALHEGVWYYFDSTGLKVTEKWVFSGNKWYYLDEDGAMVTKSWIDDKYYVNESGVMLTGWNQLQENFKGDKTTGSEGGSWYYFESNGAIATFEWVKRGSNQYWVGYDGAVVEGKWVDHKKYYVNDKGLRVPGAVYKDGDPVEQTE